MPKSNHRLIWRTECGGYEFYEQGSGERLALAGHEEWWLAWLERSFSFSFQGQRGALTARKEARPRGDHYWYAYRRVGPKMTKKYLGRTADLTPVRLEEVAAAFPPTHMPADEASRPLPDDGRRLSDREKRREKRVARVAAPSSALEALPSLPPDLFLATRLHPPRLRSHFIARPHLIAHLRAAREASLILISAPAGSGKTTLLAQWLAEDQRRAAWVSLEPADNDPVRFLSVLIAALQQLDPQLGTSALAWLHTTPPPPEAVLARLAAELLESTHQDLILVLDDYHVITTEALQRAVAALVEHAPASLHLVIATRTDPALPLARLRARGQLCEVRAAQLQFQPEETQTFLQAVMGLELETSACAVLQQRTEGWIAGLQLVVLSLQGRSDPSSFLADLSGSHRYIIDYLIEEVLARQPEPVQAFLLYTSILDRLTGPLCDAVTGSQQGQKRLEELEHANLFLVPLDERRLWYRYHHLFAEVLLARAQREMGTEGLAALYTRASRWYEQNGMPVEAVETALLASDFARAAHLIDEPLVASIIMRLQFATLRRWLECFPQEQLFTTVFLCLAYAYSLFWSETPQAHEGPLAVAERLSQAEGDHKRLGQAYTLRAIGARVQGDGVQAISYGTQALQLLPEDALLGRSTAMSALAEGYQLNGEVAAARRVLAESRWLHEQSGNMPSILGHTIALGDLLIMQGKLSEATNLYAPLLQVAGEWHYFAIQALIGLGTIARERNELEQAEALLEQAIDLARKTHDRVLLARAALLRARVVQARGEDERTRAAFAEALELAQQCRYVGLVEQAQAYQARSWLSTGHLTAALQWQAACALTRATAPAYEREASALTLVRMLLTQGEAGEALLLLDRWHQHAHEQGRTGSEIEMLVLAALAHHRQGKSEQAVQRLQPALLLASPEGYVRVFVDEGTPMVALLSLVLSRWKSKPEASFLHALLSVGQAEPPAQGSLAPSAPHGEPPLEPLTDREHKVLRLLAAGLSNTEIAAELVVSINTIRTQARSIYHKLNAKNRHEAVALARHWRLL